MRDSWQRRERGGEGLLRERAVGEPHCVEERGVEFEQGVLGEGAAAGEVGAQGVEGVGAGLAVWGWVSGVFWINFRGRRKGELPGEASCLTKGVWERSGVEVESVMFAVWRDFLISLWSGT